MVRSNNISSANITPYSIVTYEPLHHKYRPQTFAELVGQEAIAQTLTSAILQDRIAPAYLFTGPRGTGKTSSARIFAKSLNCISTDAPTPTPCGKCNVCQEIARGSTLDVIEIDAASNTGVDNIRDLIERAQFAPVQCRYKVYVIDEVHMLSTQAFNALLKTLEEPPNRVVFVLATTDPQRVLPTIISRCQRFDFRRIALDSMTAHLHKIAKLENINIASDAVYMVAQLAQGGLRDAESLLDQLSLFPDEITIEKVWDLVGAVPENDLMELLEAVKKDDATALIDMTRHLMNRGREPLIVLQSLASFYRDLLMAKAAPKRSDLVALTSGTWDKLVKFATQWDAELILASQKHLQTHEVQIKNTTQPRLWLEVTLLGLLPSAIRTQQQPANQPAQIHPPQPPLAKGGSQISNIEESSVPNLQHPPMTSPPIANRTENTPTAPIREPIQTADTTNYTPTNSASEIDLNQVWEQVLSRVRPQGTQSLLRQHGHLVSFSNDAASIKINSPQLLKMVKDKVANIEEAFLQIFNRRVSVQLGLKSSNETNSLEPNNLANSNGAISPNAQNFAPVDQANQQVQNSEISENFLRDGGEGQKHSPAPENTSSKLSNVSEPGFETNKSIAFGNDLSTQAVAVRADAQDVVNSAGVWAEMFDGEVVDLSDDLEIWESETFRWESEPDLPQLSAELGEDDFIDW
jgi:DNA polymerase III subunit gamma/tau